LIVNESELDRLVNLIYENIRRGRWLYWPPGPMTGQIFDKDMCKRELKEFLEAAMNRIQPVRENEGK